MAVEELVIWKICGGSDGPSGLNENSGICRAFDLLIEGGAAGTFEETWELIGEKLCMTDRALTPN